MKSKATKMVVAILVMLLMVLTAACTSAAPAQTSAAQSETQASAPSEAPAASSNALPSEAASESAKGLDGTGLKFAGTCWSFTDTFIASIRNHSDADSKALGATIEFNDAQGNQTTQLDAINGYISKGVNGLMVNIIDTTATGVVLKAASEGKIPVVFFEHEPEEKDLNTYDKCWTAGSNNLQGGTFMGELMLDYWKTQTKADRNGNGIFEYILIEGQVGDTCSEKRSQYIESTLNASGLKVKMVGNSVGEWARATAYDQMAGFISSLGLENIDGVLAVCDDMAIGAVEALKVNGYNKGKPGDENYIPVVGIDGTDAGFDAISTGALWATVLNDAKTYADVVTKVLVAAASGKEVNEQTIGYPVNGKYIVIDHIKITQENWKEIQSKYKES